MLALGDTNLLGVGVILALPVSLNLLRVYFLGNSLNIVMKLSTHTRPPPLMSLGEPVYKRNLPHSLVLLLILPTPPSSIVTLALGQVTLIHSLSRPPQNPPIMIVHRFLLKQRSARSGNENNMAHVYSLRLFPIKEKPKPAHPRQAPTPPSTEVIPPPWLPGLVTLTLSPPVSRLIASIQKGVLPPAAPHPTRQITPESLRQKQWQWSGRSWQLRSLKRPQSENTKPPTLGSIIVEHSSPADPPAPKLATTLKCPKTRMKPQDAWLLLLTAGQ